MDVAENPHVDFTSVDDDDDDFDDFDGLNDVDLDAIDGLEESPLDKPASLDEGLMSVVDTEKASFETVSRIKEIYTLIALKLSYDEIRLAYGTRSLALSKLPDYWRIKAGEQFGISYENFDIMMPKYEEGEETHYDEFYVKLAGINGVPVTGSWDYGNKHILSKGMGAYSGLSIRLVLQFLRYVHRSSKSSPGINNDDEEIASNMAKSMVEYNKYNILKEFFDIDISRLEYGLMCEKFSISVGKWSAYYGKLEIFNLYWNQNVNYHNKSSEAIRLITSACMGGNEEIVDDMLKYVKHITNVDTVLRAAFSGNITIFNKLMDIINKDAEDYAKRYKNAELEIKIKMRSNTIFEYAAMSGNVEMFDRVFDVISEPLSVINFESVLYNAARMGKFKMMLHILDKGEKAGYRFTFRGVHRHLAMYGDVEMLDSFVEFLQQEYPIYADQTQFLEKIQYGAITGGHVNVLKLYYPTTPEQYKIMLIQAIKENKSDIVKFMVKNVIGEKVPTLENKYIYLLSRFADLETLMAFEDSFFSLNNQIFLENAITHGNLMLVEYLLHGIGIKRFMLYLEANKHLTSKIIVGYLERRKLRNPKNN